MTTPEDTGETYSITIKGEIYLLISQYMSNPPIFLMNEIDNLITLHTQNAYQRGTIDTATSPETKLYLKQIDTKARIDELNHLGYERGVTSFYSVNKRIKELEAHLTNPTEAREK